MSHTRDSVLDNFRGLIMILMALDHSATFVAKHSVGSEVWGCPLPQYSDYISFIIRWISHLCAPGFSFLVGVSLVFLFKSRMDKGWDRKKIWIFIFKRGVALIFLQHIIYNGAWFVFLKMSTLESTPFPGGGGTPLFAFSVLSALGIAMIFWGVLLNVSISVIVIISFSGIILTQVIISHAGSVETLYNPIVRLLFIPGQTGSWLVRYPFIPWLSIVGFGIIWGRVLLNKKNEAYKKLFYTGFLLVVAFFIIRSLNGFGNTHKWEYGFISFMNVTKFPPSLAYTSITLGLNFLIITLFTKVDKSVIINLLGVYGRSPLFFYLSHIYLYLVIGLFFPKGLNLLTFFPLWIAGLLILYIPCKKYGCYKKNLSVNSFWKMF